MQHKDSQNDISKQHADSHVAHIEAIYPVQIQIRKPMNDH